MQETENSENQRVTIYTDGACIGNPGPGGYAAILTRGDARKIVKGRVPGTTNNRMELSAPIEALRSMKRLDPVTIVSDSEYVVKGMTEWLEGWKARGWKNSNKKPVLNRDLWEALDELVAARPHGVVWEWVRGHNGHALNEEVDKLANAEAAAAHKRLRRASSRSG